VAFALQDSLEKLPNCEIAVVTDGEQTLQQTPILSQTWAAI